MPKVSVIMNCYNGEKYLKDSIQSVINQSYKNWELIFWDNKSTDESKKIFKSFKDRRLKYYFSETHTNLYQARNNAISKSKGKILTFLDVDDIWLKNKLKLQIKEFKKKDINLVYSNFYIKKKIGLINYNKVAKNFKLPSGFITNDILKNYSVGLLTIAIRKKNLKKKLFNPKLNLIADYEFLLNFSIKNRIQSIQKPLAIYRVHPNQQQRKYFFDQASDFLKLYKKIKENRSYFNFSNFKYFKKKAFFCFCLCRIKKKKLLSNFLYFLKIKDLKLKIKLIMILFFRKFLISYVLKTY